MIIKRKLLRHEMIGRPEWKILKEDIPLGTEYELDLSKVDIGTLRHLDLHEEKMMLAVYCLESVTGHPGYPVIQPFLTPAEDEVLNGILERVTNAEKEFANFLDTLGKDNA